MNILSIFPTERSRWLTHLGLALLTFVWCYLSFGILPDTYTGIHVLAVATGYIAFLFLIITLLIGPIQLVRQKRKRNPVNINIRRDIGIWAALIGLLHVVFGFQVHLQGQIARYFFEETASGLKPLLSLFGASNYLGAAATIILFLLLLLSNDISLRWLKGKLWKNFQRFNYGLFILVLAHTIGYQFVIDREPIMQTGTIILTVILLTLQGTGFFLTQRRQTRKTPISRV
jgi:sulfoxide reductase heme-binding subunit YedZ